MTTSTGRGSCVLVSGGAGFIGSHVVTGLIGAGHRVRVLDDLSTGDLDNLAGLRGRFEFQRGSAADPESCRVAVAGIDAVIHLAAIPSVPHSFEHPLESHASGPTATLTLLEAARTAGARRFLFASSSSIYGDASSLPVAEDAPARPMSPYAVGKLAGEHYVRVYARSTAMDGASLRFFNIFGPRQDPRSPYSGVISLFVRAYMLGRRPRIHGDGRQTRDFTYVTNVVRAILLALEHPGRLDGVAFNVGTGRRVSLRELVAALDRLFDRTSEPEYASARVGDILDSQADVAAIRAALGYVPHVRFEDGLAATVEWVRSQAAGEPPESAGGAQRLHTESE